ncbi:DUF2239 family protein [Phenylobacterium sp. 20VBR1]|uniref:DUF2239 family protein n=2 Tax=Phenylobacterium glaciei TaxID=2803784 RepID=A0A941D237_9CAUL|nr:DUF2239 family protein [Phenylobacterium glaciei]
MSRDAQQYSLENQKAQIAAYAAEHRIEVVATYADAGKSGVRLEGRESLQQLLADVLTGQADFKLILVQDISRWGRFQDPDEAAHYEYICRTAGVDIQYCAEAFRNSATPTGSVLKAMKRLMAAEYSRELSRKCFAGAARLSALGFRQGGAAGYGLRRQLVDENGKTKIWLDAGDQKYLSTDRVVLTLGPAHEVETVRRIYRLFTYEGCGKQQIADLLNAEGIAGEAGRAWRAWTVAQVLSNEKYIGSIVYGREVRWLGGRRVIRPPADHIRADGAFQAIVSRDLFMAARKVAAAQSVHASDAELLDQLSALRVRMGVLSHQIINSAPGVASTRTYGRRFGGLRVAYRRIGYVPTRSANQGCPHITDPEFISGYIDPRRANAENTGVSPLQDRVSVFTAFAAEKLISSGDLPTVALAVKTAVDAGVERIVVFEDATGRPVDLDLRGTPEEVRARFAPATPGDTPPDDEAAKPGRGRPKLGVTAREVTLLPRHWDWLAGQPGGASAALRRLVEAARRESAEADAARRAQEAAYRVMSTLAGNLPDFEEATRAFFAGDQKQFHKLCEGWPRDLREYVGGLVDAIGHPG